MALVTIYKLQTLKTGSHFFHKGPYYLLKMFLGQISMGKVPKNAEMCQILAIFFSSLVKLPYKTKWPWTGFSHCLIGLKF